MPIDNCIESRLQRLERIIYKLSNSCMPNNNSTSGTSGLNGNTGINGLNGTSGTSGIGASGTSGTSGNGTSGTSGVGDSGTSGTSGVDASGTSGTSGVDGLSVVTADNGLSTSTPTNIQLGGSQLLQDSSTVLNPYSFTFNSSNLNRALLGNNTGSGKGIEGISSTGEGVYGSSSSGSGVSGFSINGPGVSATSSNSFGGVFQSNTLNSFIASGAQPAQITTFNSTSGNIIPTLNICRTTASNPTANDTGGGIDFYITTDLLNLQLSNQLISKWTDSANPTRTSQFIISGVNNAVTNNIAYFNGNGMVGIGSPVASATRLNTVDNSVGAAPIVNISTTSPNAASHLQTGLNVTLSGANSNILQRTYGIYSTNAHTGSGFNFAGYFTSFGGAVNYGVAGIGDTIGVYGRSAGSSGYAVYAEQNSTDPLSFGVYSQALGGVAGAFRTDRSVLTNNVLPTIEVISTTSAGVGTDGIGGSITYKNATSVSGSTIEISNELISKWVDATLATRTSEFKITGTTNATTEDWLTLGQSGYMKLREMNVSEANAITPSNGMILYVNNTDATFTSVGFWGYEAGAWVKL